MSLSSERLQINPTARSRPTALTIAGSDSGGGAGVQADLRTFVSLGVHGTSVVTAITAQNPREILSVKGCSSELISKQLEAVCSEFPPRAIKVGMLWSRAAVEAVVSFFESTRPVPLIVDPILIATSGRPLIQGSAKSILRERLLPLSCLVTPNLPETTWLVGKQIHTPGEMQWAAREICRRYKCAALVKGGHLGKSVPAIDVYYDGRNELLLTTPRLSYVKTHGTGCIYSAAIASYLARGKKLPEAVALAKQHITRAIRHAYRSGRRWVLP